VRNRRHAIFEVRARDAFDQWRSGEQHRSRRELANLLSRAVRAPDFASKDNNMQSDEIAELVRDFIK
jgi:hypothetical protein